MTVEEQIKSKRADLERMADEIRLQVHLANNEVKTTWKRLEPRIHQFSVEVDRSTKQTSELLKSYGNELATEAQQVWEQVKRATKT